MADDNSPENFDPEAGQDIVFTLDFSGVIPDGVALDTLELRATNLPDAVTPADGDVDTDRNWSLTMTTLVGATIAVPAASSASELLADITFEIVDTASGEIIAKGQIDGAALEQGAETITILPQTAIDEIASEGGAEPGSFSTPADRADGPAEQATADQPLAAVDDDSGDVPPDIRHEAVAEALDLQPEIVETPVEPAAEPEEPGQLQEELPAEPAYIEHEAIPNRAPTDIVLNNNNVGENVASGTIVGTASATDPDPGETYRYSLVDDAGGRFAIDAVTGVVTVTDGSLLDFETTARHDITFRVTDSAGNGYVEEATIDLIDLNEAPTDLSLSGNSVAENAANGTVVGAISAADPDAGESFSYSLTDDANGRFAIDAQTGIITVADGAQLDFETANQHSVTARITDSGNNFYDESVLLNVRDANETLTGDAGANTLTGGIGDDTILGLGGNDILVGNDGNDQLSGGTGADRLSGGGGDDLLQVSADGVWTGRNAAFNGNTGEIASLAGKTRSYDVFDGGDGYDTIVGTDRGDALFLGDTASPFPGGREARLSGIEEIDLGAGNDVLDMNHPSFSYTDDIIVRGGDGNDVLWTDQGDDTLDGGAGADRLDGGGGIDTATYEGSSAGVTVNLTSGQGSGGDAQGDSLYGVENLMGSDHADMLTGDAGANTLTGGAGDDTLQGLGGNDLMIGGGGSDRFVIGEADGNNKVEGGAGAGWTDTIQLTNADGSAVGKSWSVILNTGAIQDDDGDTMTLSDDAAGTITLDDGSQIAFEGIERIEY